jgi:hypothetical protein
MMSMRTFSLRGKRRLMASILAVVGFTAMVAILAAVVLHSNVRVALGSGSGGGCISTTGPVCTFKDNRAFADFGSVSSDGCIFTDAAIQPFQSLTRPGNTTSQSVFVFIEKFDFCNNVPLEEASNFDPTTGAPNFTGTIQFGGTLATATVNGTASMVDLISNTTFTATINVAWQGFGTTTRFIDNSHFRAPNFIVNSHFSGTSRAAEASGTLTDETGTNLATSPTLNAGLDNTRGGTVQITGL